MVLVRCSRAFRLATLVGLAACQRAPVETTTGPHPEPSGSAGAESTTPTLTAPAAPEAPGWLGTRIVPGADQSGAVVAEVVHGTPAARAGVRAGDQVVGVGPREVNTASDVNVALGSYRIGQPFELRYRRAGVVHAVLVALEAMPDADELLRLRFVGRQAPSLAGLVSPPGTKQPERWTGSRATVVEFWASWCGTCQLLAGTLNEWHEKYGQRGVRILGVTREDPALALPVAERLIRYEVALDRDSALSEAFDVRTLPMLFVIDESGTVRDVMRGFERAGIQRIEAFLAGKETP